MKNSKKSTKKIAPKFVVKNGLRFLRKNHMLVFDGIIQNTIDSGFHSYARKQRA